MGKTSRKILLDFDSIIDTQIGFARYMQIHHQDLIDDWLKEATTLEQICEARLRVRNFALSIFKLPNRVTSDTLRIFGEVWEDIFTNNYDEIIELSPKVPQTKQIISIYNTAEYSKFMDCHLLCRYQREVDVLHKEFPNNPTFLVGNDDHFNYSQYARVIIGNYNYIWHMQREKIEFTYITVLSYPDNFELIKDDQGSTIKKINSSAIWALGDTNQFELLDIHF